MRKRDLKHYPTGFCGSRDPRGMSVDLFLRIDLRYMNKLDLLDLLFWSHGCDLPLGWEDDSFRTLLCRVQDARAFCESNLQEDTCHD